MAPSIGVNLRVTGHCNQGDRQYMEDVFSIAYQQTEDEKGLEYAFFGIFDGHGGGEAAQFAKQNLMEFVVNQKNFWSDDDELVLKAIREGFIATHQAMWRELDRWPRTVTGLPSTSGCTASVAFIRRGKIYIGHVGDSAIVLGYEHPSGESKRWLARSLTRDHKPESLEECTRIADCGGKVINKSGVSRVVWNRPRTGHRGPIRRSTQIVEVPFLAVARSLGDLWSYNSSRNEYVVSPEPDLHVLSLDVRVHRCLVLATDGVWNVLGAQWAVDSVSQSEAFSEHWLSTHAAQRDSLSDSCALTERQWINPSKQLVDLALSRWKMRFLRADNTSVITVMLDPPGPPKHQLVCRRASSSSARTPLNRHCSSMSPTSANTPAYHGPCPSQDYKVFTPEPTSSAADSDAENRSCHERKSSSSQVSRSTSSRHRLLADRTPRTRRAALLHRRVLRSHNGPTSMITARVR